MKSIRFLSVLPIALAALLVGACGRPPLVPDAPKGPTQWLPDIAMACTTSTTDPSGVQVSYQFDWGDGNKSEWSQFMDGGVPYSDTHSYTRFGSFAIKARAKNSKKASAWSAPLNINVVAEGHVAWSVGFTDPFEPDDPDSAEFNVNSFAIGPDNALYIASTIVGAVIACKPSGGLKWAFHTQDPYADEFHAAPVVADDGTILIGCVNEFIYALDANGAVKWRDSVGSSVSATGALGADGTAYFQTEDSMLIALRSNGSRAWEFFTGGGNAAPVVGADGTVYAANQDGMVYAVNPEDGSQKWATNLSVPVIQAPAINPARDTMYVTTETGLLQSLDVKTGATGWSLSVGEDASGPVIGPDGSVYISASGRLLKLSPQLDSLWTFFPPLAGVLSTPAVTADGYVYVLAVAGKKRLAVQEADTLYAVNPDGTRRWACGLGEGLSDPEYALSAPKLDASGSIFVGSGNRAWCVAGISLPAQSIWPMFQRDARNTGRAR
jgi:outer membrane protein assembly factor BamB